MKFLQSSYPNSNSNKFLCLPREILENIACIHTYHCITGTPLTGHLPSSLFISAMASQQGNQEFHTQETQFGEILLNLSKGQEELRTLLMGTLVRNSSEDDKDERLKHLQAEVDSMRTHMLGQMALIQGLAREKEELRTMVNQLHQEKYNMKQTVQVRDQVIDQLPRGQESGMVKNRPLCCTPKFALPYSSRFSKSSFKTSPRVAQSRAS